MDINEKLEKKIGTKEIETLKPAKVKVMNVDLVEVKFGNKTNEKVVLSCKHPDREEPINISTVKVLKKDKVKTSGIWYNMDEEKNIQKNSVLAGFLIFAGVENLKQLVEKEFDTIADDDGFLCIKAY